MTSGDPMQAPLRETAMLGQVQSLARALGILDELGRHGGKSLSEMAKLVALPKSTVHRLLTTMETSRYVQFDRDTHLWSVGAQAFAVGTAFVQTQDLGQLGRSTMRALVAQVDHSANISVPEGSGMCYVGQVPTRHAALGVVRPGACLPMHTTAAGKALMAQWDDDEIERFLTRRLLTRRTANSIVDPHQMREELAEVRERGYAIDDEEHAEGLRCVAAVVTDRYGMPKASLSVTDKVYRLGRAQLAELGPTMMAHARQMSRTLEKQLTF